MGIVEAGRLITVISHKEQRERFWDILHALGSILKNKTKFCMYLAVSMTAP